MTENVENLVLEHLRALRGQLDQILSELGDVKHRLSSLEAGQVAIRRDLLGVVDDQVHHQAALDRLSARVERIERRLELLP